MNGNVTNSALAVAYEPIELKSHSTYNKKSFIDKLKISNQEKKSYNRQ